MTLLGSLSFWFITCARLCGVISFVPKYRRSACGDCFSEVFLPMEMQSPLAACGKCSLDQYPKKGIGGPRHRCQVILLVTLHCCTPRLPPLSNECLRNRLLEETPGSWLVGIILHEDHAFRLVDKVDCLSFYFYLLFIFSVSVFAYFPHVVLMALLSPSLFLILFGLCGSCMPEVPMENDSPLCCLRSCA